MVQLIPFGELILFSQDQRDLILVMENQLRKGFTMYESGFVTFDGELIVPALFDRSVRWNGFLCPKFDIGTCEIICKYLKVAMPQDFDYLITEYGVITKDFNYPVEDQDELWSLDENHLVSLGGWSWTWSECNDVGLSI